MKVKTEIFFQHIFLGLNQTKHFLWKEKQKRKNRVVRNGNCLPRYSQIALPILPFFLVKSIGQAMKHNLTRISFYKFLFSSSPFQKKKEFIPTNKSAKKYKTSKSLIQ